MRIKNRAKAERVSESPGQTEGFFSGFRRDAKLAPGKYTVRDDRTPVYRFGPSQALPDAVIGQGQVLVLIEWKRGFSKVRLPDGMEGYVPNDRLIRAPEPTVAVAGKRNVLHGRRVSTRKSPPLKSALPAKSNAFQYSPPPAPPELPTVDPAIPSSDDELPLNMLLPPLE